MGAAETPRGRLRKVVGQPERFRIRLSGLVRKSWDRAVERLGLPRYTPHDLRHQWATVTLSNGATLHEVSRWMGHRTINTTAASYGHLTLDGRERCRQILESTYRPHADLVAASEEERRADLVLTLAARALQHHGELL
ncbi:tyrosine-type recombinase/integrase [Streptomyces olivaceiscleroticus]